MDLRDLTKSALEAGGFEGLWNPDIECGCDKDDLFPCDTPGVSCEAGYRCKIEDPNGGTELVDGYGPRKQPPAPADPEHPQGT